jgi:predicted NBD/HSP70 family sugar kinase
LARISGLQRSTVSLIVEELLREKWVLEGSTGRLPRGRRPTFLELNHQRGVIALDIHPSQTTVAVTDLGGRIVAQNIVDLPADPNKAIQPIVAAIRKLIAAHSDKSFDGIGISLPGRPDPGFQKLIFAPNLNWPALSIKSRIERATGLRVEMDNVANACVLSEVWFGDSDGMHDLVVVNVSEGIGTGIFANGKLLRGTNGMAGEFGHVQLEVDGPLCGCGGRGCWETVASNRAGLRYYHELNGTFSEHAPQSFAALVKMAQAEDAKAIKALEKMSIFLGRGLRMIASALAPSEIIIVGDITAAWYLFGPIVEAELKKNSLSKGPKLRPSFEGNTARLRSAVALVMNEGLV